MVYSSRSEMHACFYCGCLLRCGSPRPPPVRKTTTIVDKLNSLIQLLLRRLRLGLVRCLRLSLRRLRLGLLRSSSRPAGSTTPWSVASASRPAATAGIIYFNFSLNVSLQDLRIMDF